MRIATPTYRTRQSGFSLIEVLVAVIILSIGLLGLAGLQVIGSQNNQDALFRSQATLLAGDIIDRMRANREAALDGDYETNLTDGPPSGSTIASLDLAAWKNRLADDLPSGQGAVDLTSDNTVEITIQWDERAVTEGGGNTIQFRTDSRL